MQKFEIAYKEIDKFFGKTKKYKEAMFSLIESSNIEGAGNFCDILKAIRAEMGRLISQLKSPFLQIQIADPEGENCDDSLSSVASSNSEGSEGRVSFSSDSESEEDEDSMSEIDPFETFATNVYEFQKIYSKAWSAHEPEKSKDVQASNDFHRRFCDAILSLLAAGNAISWKMGEETTVELIEELQKTWDRLSRKEKGVEIRSSS